MKKLILVFVVISCLLASCTQVDTVQTPDPATITRIDELITGYVEEGEFSGHMTSLHCLILTLLLDQFLGVRYINEDVILGERFELLAQKGKCRKQKRISLSRVDVSVFKNWRYHRVASGLDRIYFFLSRLCFWARRAA